MSLTVWLISLSIMLSSSIHAVANGRNSFFLLHSIPLCKCTILFKICFMDYAITVAPFPPLSSPTPCAPPPTCIPPFSSCLWIIHISSLASPFPILFLTSPCLFSTYHLCYLFSVPFPLSPPPTPLFITLHVISISVVLFLFWLFA